jgi:creatinine amidohydrolase/Fe(II)-dependent formamide hydrolase-like protein
VGNDALKAERLCELAAERSGGFAFPTLWYGDSRGHSLAENHCDDHEGVQVDHAAKWETSFLLYLRPDCVDLGVYADRGEEPLVGVKSMDLNAPVEDPRRTASEEIGRRASELMVEGMIRKARELLRSVQSGGFR